MATAQAISARYGHSTLMFAPSISDIDMASAAATTRYGQFVPQLLDALDARGYARTRARRGRTTTTPTSSTARRRPPRAAALRGSLNGRWGGYSTGQGRPSTSPRAARG